MTGDGGEVFTNRDTVPEDTFGDTRMTLLEIDSLVVVPEQATREMRRRLASVPTDTVVVLVQRLRQASCSSNEPPVRNHFEFEPPKAA